MYWYAHCRRENTGVSMKHSTERHNQPAPKGAKIGFGIEPMKMNKGRTSKFRHRNVDNTNHHYERNYSGMNGGR